MDCSRPRDAIRQVYRRESMFGLVIGSVAVVAGLGLMGAMRRAQALDR